MIEAYKYMSKCYDVDKPKFELAEGKSCNTRGHSLKLKKHQHLKGKDNSFRNSFFSERIFDKWNSLPEEVVKAPSVNAFKDRLDRFWANYPSKFDPDCFKV